MRCEYVLLVMLLVASCVFGTLGYLVGYQHAMRDAYCVNITTGD